jgi:hypothetical protein
LFCMLQQVESGFAFLATAVLVLYIIDLSEPYVLR